MRLTGAFQIINLIRELDLGEIRDEAEQRFDILVVGQPIMAEAVADRLGATPGRHGLHPWIRIHHLPLRPGDEPRLNPERFTLAILLAQDLDPSLSEAEALRRLDGAGVPTVLTVLSDAGLDRVGADLVRDGRQARAIVSSEPTSEDISLRLAPALLSILPAGRGLRVALARRLPALREPFIRSIVDDVARANALYSMTTGLAEQIPLLNVPLNAADVVVLTKNQLLMAYKIALAAGKSGRPVELMGEIVSVLGGGFFFRELARKLVGLVPVIGLVPKVAVAYAGTRVIGTIVQRWASEGRRIRIEEMHALYDEALRGGRELAKSLAERLDLGPGAGRADGDAVAGDATRGGRSSAAEGSMPVDDAAIQTWKDEGGAINPAATKRGEEGDGATERPERAAASNGYAGGADRGAGARGAQGGDGGEAGAGESGDGGPAEDADDGGGR